MDKEDVIALVSDIGTQHIVTESGDCEVCGFHYDCVTCGDVHYIDHTLDEIIDAIEDGWVE